MSGNSRIPSSPPEAFLPLLGLSALLLGLGALFGHVFADDLPVREIGEDAVLGTIDDVPIPAHGFPVLLSTEARGTYLAEAKSYWPVRPTVLDDEEQTLWVRPGTAVEVVDASHAQFTGIRILEGSHAGTTGWVWLRNLVREGEH